MRHLERRSLDNLEAEKARVRARQFVEGDRVVLLRVTPGCPSFAILLDRFLGTVGVVDRVTDMGNFYIRFTDSITAFLHRDEFEHESNLPAPRVEV